MKKYSLDYYYCTLHVYNVKTEFVICENVTETSLTVCLIDNV